MVTKYYVINDYSWINDTWLAPYCGCIVRLDKFVNGTKRLTIDGDVSSHNVTESDIMKNLTRTRKKYFIKAFKF